MKILRIVSAGYEQGGVENGIVLTNKILRQHGHTVVVLSGDSRPDLKHYSDYEYAGIPTRGIKKILYAAFNLNAYKTTKKILNDFKPDVVLLHTMSQPTASVLFLLKKYPCALFVHGPEIFTKSLLPWYLSKKDYRHGTYKLRNLTFAGWLHYVYFRYICGFFYKLGLRNVNQIVALSSYTQRMLEREHFKPLYLPNGAQLLNPTTPLPANPVLLYAGRLEKFKGVDDLLRAMSEILRTIPNATLEIAGEGSFGGELVALTKELKLEKAVTFLGHLDQQQMAVRYQKCTIFTMPSIWPETFGKVGIEAMSVGRPVVATDVGGVRDWLADGKNGFLIKPHRPDQIAEMAIELLTNQARAKKMGREAQKTAQQFSIEQMTANIEKLINRLV